MPAALQGTMLDALARDPRQLPVAMLPFFIAMSGIILPLMMTTQLLINERERRTLELLVALPVRIEQVLFAKMLAVLMVTAGITVPLVTFDAIYFLVRGVAQVGDVAGLPLYLLSVLAFASSAALLLSLLAKDYATANNLAGAMVAPAVFLTLALCMLLPAGIARALTLALLYLVAAAVLTRTALRTVTFERLLS